MLYSFFKIFIFTPLVRGLFRGKISGVENIPATGAAVLASNHLGAGDPYVMATMLPRPITFPAKEELFRGHSIGTKIVAWFVKAMHAVPLNRSGGRASLEAFAPVLAMLADGNLVGIYPEGTRTPDGHLHKGKTGVARIALLADVPVIPVAVVDSQTVRPFGVPWISHPRVIVGRPLDFTQFHGQSDNHAVLRYVTDEVMNAIMELSGQRYIDVYGASIKSGAVSEDVALTQHAQARPGSGIPPAAERDGD